MLVNSRSIGSDERRSIQVGGERSAGVDDSILAVAEKSEEANNRDHEGGTGRNGLPLESS